ARRPRSTGPHGFERFLGQPRLAPAAVAVQQVRAALGPPAAVPVELERAGVVDQLLDDPPGLEHAVLTGEALLDSSQSVREQPFVGPGLAAELLLEEQVEGDAAKRLVARLFRLEEEADPRVGIDPDDDLVRGGTRLT